MPFLNFNIKITSFDFENPLEVFQTDGTISIPKEVILLALNRSLCRSESRRGLISADKTDFFPQASRLIVAHFALASSEKNIIRHTQKRPTHIVARFHQNPKIFLFPTLQKY